MKRCVSLENEAAYFAQELSMNSTWWINETVCWILKFAFPVLRKSCVSPSPAPVSTFWSVGPSNLLNVNANVELKRGSKHNLRQLFSHYLQCIGNWMLWARKWKRKRSNNYSIYYVNVEIELTQIRASNVYVQFYNFLEVKFLAHAFHLRKYSICGVHASSEVLPSPLD